MTKDISESNVQQVFSTKTTIAKLIEAAKRNGKYKDPYADINFIEFHPVIKDRYGNTIFDEKVVFPDYFRENDVKIVASKYLANQAKKKETDLREMIDRVSDTITNWAISSNYFNNEHEACEFNYKLKYYQIRQYFAFNSPVYFNIGLYDKPALSACFITSIEDNMESITDLYARESRLFKGGSGNGANFSHLRSSKERVKGGGFASGPVSFLKASDTCAGIVKSGGTLRRAAKMACLNIDHPDIIEFIQCKDREEEKLRILKEAGFKPESGREFSDEVYFQNTNFSVRLTDDFMKAVKENGSWHTREVLTGDIHETFNARELLTIISKHAWTTGDPGVMFHDNINAMNTVPSEGEIEASNPCVVGDTILRSPEGDIKIKDLVESGRTEIPVYCCDPKTGEVHIRIGRNPRKTGENKPVYKVTYSKGRGGIHSITTTSNHKFLDNEGNIIECKDLIFETKGKTRLMPFNKLTETYRTSGGKEVYIYSRIMKIKESHLVLNWKHGEKIKFGRKADEFVAHHIDGNHINNHPDNLEIKLNRNHSSDHSSGENNARYGVKVSDESRKKMSESHIRRFRENGTIFETECDYCGCIFETNKTHIRSGSFCDYRCRVNHYNDLSRDALIDKMEELKHECPYCSKMIFSKAKTCGSDECLLTARRNGLNYDDMIFDRKQAAIASIKSKALNLGTSLICEGFDISYPEFWDMWHYVDLETFEGKKRVSSNIILKYWGNWESFLNEVESHNHIVLNVEYVGEEDVYNITVDEFHTVAWNDIITKNCGEWNFLNDTPCNLAAFNALKFFNVYKVHHDASRIVFDYTEFKDVIDVMVTSQDLFCEYSDFPAEIIRKNAKRYRTIGLGFSNIAALCMYLGYPYDSKEARALVSTISSLMTASAYEVSTNLASRFGVAEWWENALNHETMFNVMRTHRKSASDIDTCNVAIIDGIKKLGCSLWDTLVTEQKAPRAASTTLCAPTGTTGYLMSVDSFGPEPFFSLISYKTLSGNDGATLKLVSDTPRLALKNLGYSNTEIDTIISELVDNDIPIENSTIIKKEHIPIFDTSLPPTNGKRAIKYMGHVDMLAAIQPFISSAISKTINMSNDCTVEDIFNLYCYTWEKGLKSITVYRDGSKTEQILNTKKKENNVEPTPLSTSVRKKMPSKRNAEINKFTIHGIEGKLEGYITRGLYPNGDLGEVFIELAKDGSTVKGLVGAVVTLTSVSLQYGVPLVELVEKMLYRRFEPSGWVKGDEHIRQCSSIIDYIFRHLAFNHLSNDDLIKLGLKNPNNTNVSDCVDVLDTIPDLTFCPICNTQLRKLGTCTFCSNCSWSDGSCS